MFCLSVCQKKVTNNLKKRIKVKSKIIDNLKLFIFLQRKKFILFRNLHKMKKIAIALIAISGLLFTGKVQASHIAGCDLSYTCIGGNDYLITLTFYRDCSGISEPSSVSINFQSSCGSFNVTLQKIPPINGVEVTPVCPGQATTCSGGSLYGLERFIYQGQVTLTPCADWVMSYSLCCRNPSNTIQSPTSANMYIPATLNNLAAPCNSSPTFTNAPATIICNGQQFCFNHGAIDPDGDSLVYSMVTPFNYGPGSGTPYVVYLGGYTAQQPLQSNPPVSLDPMTGDICMTPTTNLTTVFAVLVEEWRTINGVPTLIGTVLRDMQLTVVTCNNTLPTLAGINPSATQYNPTDTTYILDVCLGDTVSFGIFAHDNDAPADNLTITWNSGIPSGTWSATGNGTPNAQASFYWIPNSSFISNVPYCFTATVADDNCPYVGTQTFSYCITIKGIVVELDPPNDTLLCQGEVYTLQAHGDTNAINYYWAIDGNPVTPLNDTTLIINTATLSPGTHTIAVTVDDGSMTICPGVDYITLTVVQTPSPNLGPDQTICIGDQVVLDAGPGANYLWSTGQTTQTISVGATGTYIVEVDGGNNTPCKAYDTINIFVLQLPTVDLGPDLCIGDTVTLNAGNPGFQYQWSLNGQVVSYNQSILINQTGTYSVIVSEDLNMPNCSRTDDIFVHVIPHTNFTLGNDTTLCQHQSIEIKPKDPSVNLANYDYTYAWTLDGMPYNLLDPNMNSIVLSWLPPGQHIVGLTMHGCDYYTDSLVLTIELCDITIPNIFTPNGDARNDIFGITGIRYYPNSTLTVYNRWGRKVFESSNYDCNQESDGTISGNNCWTVKILPTAFTTIYLSSISVIQAAVKRPKAIMAQLPFSDNEISDRLSTYKLVIEFNTVFLKWRI
jgi:gliding motility-associated-like protein